LAWRDRRRSMNTVRRQRRRSPRTDSCDDRSREATAMSGGELRPANARMKRTNRAFLTSCRTCNRLSDDDPAIGQPALPFIHRLGLTDLKFPLDCRWQLRCKGFCVRYLWSILMSTWPQSRLQLFPKFLTGIIKNLLFVVDYCQSFSLISHQPNDIGSYSLWQHWTCTQ
jgi:hypothetical protein